MKKKVLVRNKAAAKATTPVAQLQRFTINLLPKCVRNETLEGRDYTVVPMVMLTEGVFKGSNGALLYPEDELSKSPSSWDHKPIVMDHPEDDETGDGISACTPFEIERRKVGIMLNTSWDDDGKRLLSEAWIENEKADKVDERVLEAINGNEIMEVSTGLGLDREEDQGEFNGREYKGIARNLRPDHLALLPDKIGACSISDGAGLCRNAAHKDPSGKLANKLIRVLKELGLTDNELSFDGIRTELTDAIKERLKVRDSGPWPWVVDIYSDFFVYDYDGDLFLLGYSSSNKGVTLSDDDPKEVKRETKYRTVAGTLTGNRDQSKKETTMKLTDKERKKKIAGIIANKSSGWSESDRPVLEAMKDKQLENIAKAVEPKKEEEEQEVEDEAETVLNEEGEDDKNTETEEEAEEAPKAAAGKTKAAAGKPDPKAKGKPTTNKTEKPFDYNAWLNSAPAQVRDFVTNGTSLLNEEKGKLIEEITANENNSFTEEQLKHRPLGELRAIANLARSKKSSSDDDSANYFASGAQTVTSNTGGPKITPLALPSMNALFEDEAEKAAATK